MVHIRAFDGRHVDGLVALCNRHMRAVPYTPELNAELFARRIVGHPFFDPEDLLLAFEREALVGMVHVGFWPRPQSPSARAGWLGPYWEYGTIVNLLFPPGDPGLGASLIDVAEGRIRGRGRNRFAAFSRLGGYLFWKDLLLAGEPLCWDGWDHVQQALTGAGYIRQEPTVLMDMTLAERPKEIPAGLDLEIRVQEMPREQVPSPFSGFGGQSGTNVLACHQGEFAGSCAFAPFEDPVKTKQGAPIAAFGMGTVDKFQRKGVGTQVLTHALGVMWDQGIRKVVLQTGDDNTPAVRLYEKIGFAADPGAHSHGFCREKT